VCSAFMLRNFLDLFFGYNRFLFSINVGFVFFAAYVVRLKLFWFLVF